MAALSRRIPGFAVHAVERGDCRTGRRSPWLMNIMPEGEPLRVMTRALGLDRQTAVPDMISDERSQETVTRRS